MDLTSPYRVFVQRLNGACAPALLTLCEPVNGSLSSVAEIDTYTLSGVASGHPVSISMVKSATASLVEHIELYAGNGTSLGTATSSGQGAVITTTLALTAPYTVLARDAANSTAGGYRLTVERTDAACPGLTFTDDPLSASVTPVRAVHFTELRQSIDELRLDCGLEAFGYADSIASGVTIRAAHLIELRTALNEVFDCRAVTRPTFTDPAPVAGQTLIKAVHIDELRRAVESIQ
jgi:hypothetical protein